MDKITLIQAQAKLKTVSQPRLQLKHKQNVNNPYRKLITLKELRTGVLGAVSTQARKPLLQSDKLVNKLANKSTNEQKVPQIKPDVLSAHKFSMG